MNEDPPLIPPPPVVRKHLARHIREGRLLRSLYRLSVRASEERRTEHADSEAIEETDSRSLTSDPRPDANDQGVAK